MAKKAAARSTRTTRSTPAPAKRKRGSRGKRGRAAVEQRRAQKMHKLIELFSGKPDLDLLNRVLDAQGHIPNDTKAVMVARLADIIQHDNNSKATKAANTLARVLANDTREKLAQLPQQVDHHVFDHRALDQLREELRSDPDVVRNLRQLAAAGELDGPSVESNGQPRHLR